MSMSAGMKENLLHFFIRKRFENALSLFSHEVLTQEDLKQLCFQPNQAKKIPLMTALAPGMETSAMDLWKLIEKLEPVPESAKEVEELEERNSYEEENGGNGEQRKVEREGCKKEERETKQNKMKEKNNKDDPKPDRSKGRQLSPHVLVQWPKQSSCCYMHLRKTAQASYSRCFDTEKFRWTHCFGSLHGRGNHFENPGKR